MDESQKRYAEWKEPDAEKYMLHKSIYMES